MTTATANRRKTAGLLRSTGVVSSMTLLSRVFGFIRDMVLAQVFGAGFSMDAFLVAFPIPNFMRRLFAEGAFSQAFVPVLADCSEQKAFTFVRHMLGCLGSVLLLVILLGELASPYIISVFSPGFLDEPDRFNLATQLLRVTFPYLFFISLTALFGAVLNTYGRFAIPAFTPVLLNLIMIGAALGFADHFAAPIFALAWGVFLAGFIQLLFQLPFILRLGFSICPQVNWQDPAVRRVLKLMVPVLFGVSVAQIGLLLDTLFASFLPVGSISWLYYSERISSLPLGIFGVAIATVVLPHLSRKFSDQNESAYSGALDWGLRTILLFAIPSMLGLLVLGQGILTALFQYQQFSPQDVVMASKSLRAFSLGIPGFMLVKVLAAGFYSRQNVKTPVKCAVVALVVNVLAMLILIQYLAHMGLALATAISATLNATLLLGLLLKYKIYQPRSGWLLYSSRLLAANLALFLVLWWGNGSSQQWLAWSWKLRVTHLGFLLFAGVFAYFFCLHLTGFRLRELRYRE